VQRQPMTSVSSDPMSARLAVTTVAWGTELDLACSYPAAVKGGEYLGGAYALVVHTRDGRAEKVASWNGLPGKTMQLTAATASSQDQITSVELTKADGTPVARLTL